jgi:hypothetical protein
MCRLSVAVRYPTYQILNPPVPVSAGNGGPAEYRLGTRTVEVIRQGASSKKGERTLLLDCGRRSRVKWGAVEKRTPHHGSRASAPDRSNGKFGHGG